MRRHLFAGVLAIALAPAVVGWSSQAGAQQAAASLGDEVKLKDGSVFRGTITELVPKDHVDLLMASGQTRRFAAADISYAGPAKRPPVASGTGDSGGHGKGVDVHVVSDTDDVQLLIRTGQGEVEGMGWGYHGAVAYEGVARDYAIVCTAPCDTQLPPGLQRLALSHHGGRTVEAEDPVQVSGSSTLRAEYESRLGVRIAGYVIMFGSLATGVIIMATNAPQCPPTGCQFPTAFWGGLIVIVAGGILGSILTGVGDHASIQLVPTGTAARPLKLPWVGEPVAEGSSDGAGLALRYSF